MQASPRWPPEGLALRRWTIGALACVVAVIAGVNLPQQPYLIFAALLGFLYVGTIAVNAPALAWLIIALLPAALIVPFMPGRPFFWEVAAVLAWPSLAAYFLINRDRVAAMQLDRLELRALLGLAGYVAVIGLIISQRGVGFRVLGGEQMGGRVFAQQLVLAVLPFLLLAVNLSKRSLVSAVFSGWVLSLTYLIAEFLFDAGGGVMRTVLYFIELPVDGLNFEANYVTTGLRRYGSLAVVATSGLACLWTAGSLRTLCHKWALIAVPLMIALIGLGLGSGYRGMLVIVGLTFLGLSFIQRFWTVGRVIAASLIACAGLIALYATAERLPLSIQRSVSLLPGIEVSEVAKADAATTNADRIEVMKMALGDTPKYWLVGRGFGMERLDQIPMARDAGVALLYAQGMFYNGVLGSLLKIGLPGLLCTLVFVWYVSRMAIELIRRARTPSTDGADLFDRLCMLISAQWFAILLFFYLANGDVNTWMQNFGVTGALIIACRRLQQEKTEAPQSLSSVAAPR